MVVGLVVAGVCVAGAAAGGNASSRIVVSANRGGSTANLFSVGSGGALHPLFVTKSQEMEPSVSPNGTKVAYVQTASASCQTCPWTIWVMNADGSDRHGLTYPQPYKNNPTLFDQSPSWSPDGSQVVFSRSTNTSYELLIIPATGGVAHDLFIAGASPAWGPSRIAYVSLAFERPGPVTLWTVNPDGTQPRKITTSYVVSPAWSRDGKLAFLDQPPGASPLLVVLSNGIAHRYHLPFADAEGLSWSPANNRFAIVAKTTNTGPYDVYSITERGTGLQRLTTNADALGVSWGT